MDRTFVMHRPKSATALGPSQTIKAAPRLRRDFADTTLATPRPKEIGGPSGPEPTRYGDWERKGICYDF